MLNVTLVGGVGKGKGRGKELKAMGSRYISSAHSWGKGKVEGGKRRKFYITPTHSYGSNRLWMLMGCGCYEGGSMAQIHTRLMDFCAGCY